MKYAPVFYQIIYQNLKIRVAVDRAVDLLPFFLIPIKKLTFTNERRADYQVLENCICFLYNENCDFFSQELCALNIMSI